MTSQAPVKGRREGLAHQRRAFTRGAVLQVIEKAESAPELQR